MLVPTDASLPDDDVPGAASIERGRFTLVRQGPALAVASVRIGSDTAHRFQVTRCSGPGMHRTVVQVLRMQDDGDAG